VIPTKGRPQLLARSLAAVQASARASGRPVEIIVLDDGNEEATARVVAAAGPGVRYIPAAAYGGRGQGDARNHGVSVAAAAVIAFTDDDTECAEDWLARGLARLEDPALAGVEGAVVPSRGEADDFVRARIVSNEAGRGFLTANLFLRRSAFLAAGGVRRLRADAHPRWDHSFREDTDLALRVERVAGPIPFDTALRVEHPVETTSLERYLRTALFFEVDEAFLRLHPGAAPPLLRAPLARLRIRSAVLAVLALPLLGVRRAWWVAPVAILASAGIQNLQLERDLRRVAPRAPGRVALDVLRRFPRTVAWSLAAGAARLLGIAEVRSGRVEVRS
jgi:glycosyltransferase involved in cell wall biosynthesis